MFCGDQPRQLCSWVQREDVWPDVHPEGAGACESSRWLANKTRNWKTWRAAVCQADPNAPVLAAGDPERSNMKKCDEMGGIPYHINVVNYMVRAARQ